MIPSTTEAAIQFFSRLLVAAYLIEAGVLLVLAPWSGLWDRNYFADALPWLGVWMQSDWSEPHEVFGFTYRVLNEPELKPLSIRVEVRKT